MPELAIVVLVLWLATAIAGVTLLRTGNAARRAVQEQAASARLPVAHAAAVPLAPGGLPPPSPHVRVPTPVGEHPLLEFSHPTLGVTGIACWMMFTFVHYRPLAWIAFGILLVTASAGLGWLVRSLASRRQQGAWRFPARLAWLHGSVAGLSLLLTVLTAIVAARG